VTLAAALLHEAGHAVGPHHFIGRYGIMADADPNGAHGLEARWLDAWFDAYDGTQFAFHSRERALEHKCMVEIEDIRGFEPCSPWW
jgi:hypothetical protein